MVKICYQKELFSENIWGNLTTDSEKKKGKEIDKNKKFLLFIFPTIKQLNENQKIHIAYIKELSDPEFEFCECIPTWY